MSTAENSDAQPGSDEIAARLREATELLESVAHNRGLLGSLTVDERTLFVAASKSFSVDLKMRQADSQILAMQVSGTPTLVVNGKYRVNNENLKGSDEIIELVKYLVAREAGTAPKT